MYLKCTYAFYEQVHDLLEGSLWLFPNRCGSSDLQHLFDPDARILYQYYRKQQQVWLSKHVTCGSF